MNPADLRKQVALGEVALSPDGELVAYTRRTTVGDSDRCAICLVAYAAAASGVSPRAPARTARRASRPTAARWPFCPTARVPASCT